VVIEDSVEFDTPSKQCANASSSDLLKLESNNGQIEGNKSTTMSYCVHYTVHVFR